MQHYNINSIIKCETKSNKINPTSFKGHCTLKAYIEALQKIDDEKPNSIIHVEEDDEDQRYVCLEIHQVDEYIETLKSKINYNEKRLNEIIEWEKEAKRIYLIKSQCPFGSYLLTPYSSSKQIIQCKDNYATEIKHSKKSLKHIQRIKKSLQNNTKN